MGELQRVGQSKPRTVPMRTVATPAAAPKTTKSRNLDKDRLELSTPSTANATEARQKADAMWVSTFTPPASLTGFRKVERSFNDIVLKTEYWRDRDAFAQTKLNSKLEAEALGKLTPEQQAAFQRIAKPYSRDTEGNARLALQMLLIEGKLTDSRLATDGTDLLTQFDRLTTSPLADQIDRTRLVAHLLRETVEPTAMSQQNRGTCTVSAIAIMTALERPAEYVRIVAGLASPEGKATLKSGATVERLAGTEADDGTPRTLSMRLWGPAFMNFSTEAKPYNNDQDRFADGTKGLVQSRFSLALEALSGETPTLLNVSETSSDAILAQIQTATDAGKPALVSLAWGVAGPDGQNHVFHEVLVTRVTADQVFFHNPWGSEESLARDEFKTRLLDATLGHIGPLSPAAQ